MFEHIKFEWMKHLKNNFLWLFPIIIGSSHVIKAIQLSDTKLNSISFPLLAIPDSLLFVILFIIVISSNMIASEYQTGTLKLSLLRTGERKNSLISKCIIVMISLLGIIAFNICSSYIIGGLLLEPGNEILINGEALFIRDYQLEGWKGLMIIFFSEMTIIIPSIALSFLLMMLSLIIKNANLVIGLGFMYYIFGIMVSEYFKSFFLTNQILNLPSFFIRGEISPELGQMILILLVLSVVLFFLNLIYYNRMDINS